MKRTVLLTIFLISASLTIAQKIQIKKGIISKDGESIGKLEGKATLQTTDITVKSMSDLPLLHIRNVWVKHGLPYHPICKYYVIRFLPFDKTANIIHENYTSERKLIEMLYQEIGKDFLSSSGLNEEIISSFISTKDQSDKIHSDSTYIIALVKETKRRLSDPVVQRDVNSRLYLKPVNHENVSSYWPTTIETIDVYQGNVLVGRIIKKSEGERNTQTRAITMTSSQYRIMRKVAPFNVEGKSVEFIDFAFVTASNGMKPDIYVECDRAWAKDVKFDATSGEYAIVAWLIDKGCL